MADELNTYRVKKYIVEEYEVAALNRKGAIKKAETVYDPAFITVTRITVVKDKP